VHSSSSDLTLPPVPGSYGAAEWNGGAARANTSLEPEGVPWGQYIDGIRRRWLLILCVSLAGSILGFVATRFLIKPLYNAEATVWINATPNNSQAQTGPSGPIRQQQLLSSYSWVELLRSFAVVDPVVRELKLNVGYRQTRDTALFRSFEWTPSARSGAYTLTIDKRAQGYTLSTDKGTVLERGAVGDSIGRKVGLTWQPDKRFLQAGRVIVFSVSSPRATSASLIASMHPTLPENGQFLKISLDGSNALRTSRTVNTWAAQLVATSSDLKKRNLIEFKRILTDQLSLAEAELRVGEQQLEEFRVASITLPAGSNARVGPGYSPEDPVINGYFQRKAQLDEMRSEEQALERMLAENKDGVINTEGFVQIPSILNSSPELRGAIDELNLRKASLRAEKQYLTDANPRIKQLVADVRLLETETIPQITRSVLSSLKDREPELSSRIDAGTEQLRAIPVRTTEEMRLARRVAASENLYNSLKVRYGEVSIAEAETTPDLAVLDTAVTPTFPSHNDVPRYLLLATLASIGFAFGLALLLDRLDPRFRYPEQATRDLGLIITGTVPKFKANRRGEFELAALTQAVESFRTLRLALRYDFPGNVPIVLAVSSPSTADGKSLVSSNLGLAFASAGNRTLLIDGDVRRGGLHTTFDTPVTPGLVEYLHGLAPVSDIIRPTTSPNLFMIPRGTRRNRAPELLVSELMSALVHDMRAQYDVVIIDSPPLVAGIDAYALGAAAGAMLIVLRPAETDRKLAAAKLDILERLPIRILGAVLNAVPGGGAYRYYGADYTYDGDRKDGQILDIATPKGIALRA
jgi:capsular exopolysaccharide synthesis family protein